MRTWDEVREANIEAKQMQAELFGNLTLPQICLDIRMACNGAADPWDMDRLRATRAMLVKRKSSWAESGDRMDAAVYEMMQAAFHIVDNEIETRGW